ncbi:hypothetical protein EVAR_17220_1 [Eumeta japonica]|uniref:Uncharacterized protein n=1 Tax=Eumeta variegata TaxID=151549 RepID=A0A4C1UAF1_EUMVA|nr:hypothetical protein EVAR_17220_1 [Eumeta japonica]
MTEGDRGDGGRDGPLDETRQRKVKEYRMKAALFLAMCSLCVFSVENEQVSLLENPVATLKKEEIEALLELWAMAVFVPFEKPPGNDVGNIHGGRTGNTHFGRSDAFAESRIRDVLASSERCNGQSPNSITSDEALS